MDIYHVLLITILILLYFKHIKVCALGRKSMRVTGQLNRLLKRCEDHRHDLTPPVKMTFYAVTRELERIIKK